METTGSGAELVSGSAPEGDEVFKQIYACMSCVAVLMSAPSIAGAQAREATLSEVTVRGTVQAIDHTARTVTVQGEGGNVVTLDVPTTAARFDQVKVGDIVAMTYYDRVSVRAKPADEADVNRVLEPTTTTANRARSRVRHALVSAWRR